MAFKVYKTLNIAGFINHMLNYGLLHLKFSLDPLLYMTNFYKRITDVVNSSAFMRYLITLGNLLLDIKTGKRTFNVLIYIMENYINMLTKIL